MASFLLSDDRAGRVSARTVGFLLAFGPALASLGCGSSPPAAPVAPAPAATAPKDPVFDTSPVPEPAGLVLIGRVNKPSALVQTASSWARLPLPTGADLVRSITDGAVADVVDLSQPIDLAVTVELVPRRSGPDISSLAAFSVAVKSYEEAKAKLAEKHTLVAGANGQLTVASFTKRKKGVQHPPQDRQEGEDDEPVDTDGCVLTPAPTGGRLVCGEDAALTALAPYLSRTLSRRTWSSDVHLEVRPDPVRDPLKAFQTAGLGKSLIGLVGGGATGALLDASLGEVVDFVDDTQRIQVDAKVAESGIVADTRIEFQSAKSLIARAATTPGGEAPPPAFWHLPADTDMAWFSRGSDAKLFDHPRELLGNVIVEVGTQAGMPEPERGVLKDLLADRLVRLFTSGPGIYAKGFDQAALEKAQTAFKGIKYENVGPRAEAERAVVEQAAGWHLVQVSEPVAQVGPILKDLSGLWNKPAFGKWVKSKSGQGDLPRLRIAPAVANVTLPKETVHLEITIPRDPLYAENLPAAAVRGGKTPAKPAPTPKIALKPYVLHVLAVPDGAKTWLGIGLDAKLVAQKAAVSLASAPETGSLGKANGLEALREGAVSSGAFFTLRGVAALATLEHSERSPFAVLSALPHKGATPVIFTGRTEAASAGASAGAAVGTIRVSRAVIEDIVQFALSSRR